jgi:hypothetical protein
MLSVLANRTYRHLFAAQVIVLIGAGIMTAAAVRWRQHCRCRDCSIAWKIGLSCCLPPSC